MLSCEFCKISKNTVFTEHPQVTAFVYKNQKASYEFLVSSLFGKTLILEMYTR